MITPNLGEELIPPCFLLCLSMKEILINVWCYVYEAVCVCSSWQVRIEASLLIYHYLKCSVWLDI